MVADEIENVQFAYAMDIIAIAIVAT